MLLYSGGIRLLEMKCKVQIIMGATTNTDKKNWKQKIPPDMTKQICCSLLPLGANIHGFRNGRWHKTYAFSVLKMMSTEQLCVAREESKYLLSSRRDHRHIYTKLSFLISTQNVRCTFVVFDQLAFLINGAWNQSASIRNANRQNQQWQLEQQT